jgi:hypothetical protein
MNRLVVLAAVAVVIVGGCATQSGHDRRSGPDGPKVAEASMAFSDFGQLRDWRGDGTAGLYIEADSRKWYYGQFVAPCGNLPFSTHIELTPVPQVPTDSFDSIQMLGETCYFKMLRESPGPADSNAASH